MKRILDLALGIVTSIGGFLEIGSIVTAAQAGAIFGYRLAWSVVLGTVCLAFLVEMSGRFTAVSKRTIPDAIRERFGLHFFLVPLLAVLLVSLLVLASEIGGVCIALELATGVRFNVWAVPVGLAAWLLLWRGTFGVIEKGVAGLGLVTLAFIVADHRLGTDWGALGAAMLPTSPPHEPARYWFTAVSILGASISPYLFFFYSSGALEERWDTRQLRSNRVVAGLGMGFGGALSVAVLVLAALTLRRLGLRMDDYHQLAPLLTVPFGKTGLWLLVASLVICCVGAAVEIALSLAYMLAQGLGWDWGENLSPRDDARFSLTYTLLIAVASLLMATGIDPLRLTELSMALTALSLPVCVLPFLVLMNDREYLHRHTNTAVGNMVVMLVTLLAGVVAVVAIPLQIVGGG